MNSILASDSTLYVGGTFYRVNGTSSPCLGAAALHLGPGDQERWNCLGGGLSYVDGSVGVANTITNTPYSGVCFGGSF